MTNYSYDGAGRLYVTTDPLLRRTTLSYDPADNVIGKRDARGVIVTMGYDRNNRLTSEEFPDSGPASYEYDPVGNRTLAANDAGTFITTYTARNQPYVTTDPHSQTITYTYDAARNRTAMAASDGTFTYNRDAAGRLTSLENPQSETTSFTYDLNDQQRYSYLHNGVSESRDYDAARRLTNVTTVNSTDQTLTSYAYLLDKVGNCTT